MRDKLPRGWCRVRLGDVADSCLGKMLDRQKHTAGASLPYLRNQNVRWFRVDTSDVLEMFFEDDELERYALRPGDVLVCEGGEPGRAAIWDAPESSIKFQKALHRVRPSSALLPLWLVQSLWRDAQQGALETYFTGTTIKHFTGASLAKYELPLPPVAEQRRIVAKLEALQTRSRRAREALQSVPQLLEKLRQSILAAAFRGDLTKDWRAAHPDVEPASELLKRIRIERRRKWEEAELAKLKAKGKVPTDDRWKAKYVEPTSIDTTGLPELPAGWCWASLEEATLSSFYGPRFAATAYVDGGVPTIRTTDMDDTGRIRWRDPPTVKVTSTELEELGCADGDLLVTRTGSIGKCAVYENQIGPALPSAYLIRFRLVKEVILPRYVFRQLQSPRLQAALGLGTTATTQPNINARTLGAMAVAVCGIAEQAELATRLETRLESLDGLRGALVASLSTNAALDRAILAKAFRGELVPQDPNDEPAEAMLARLRASEPEPPKPSSRRRSKPKAAE